jgi:hypothetical protein
MNPIIDLAPGAEDNPLAVRFCQLIRDNVGRDPRGLSDFRAIRGTVLVVPQDTGESFTLRFDHGRLTLHDGSVGIPSVTFCGDQAALLRLPDLDFHRGLRLPVLGSLRELTGLIAAGDLKVYGLASHPRLIFALLRLLSDSSLARDPR